MKKLLNTLYILSEDVYLSLDGENAVAKREQEVLARYPLHTLQSVISFSYAGISIPLMGACVERGISVALCSPRGKFLAHVCGGIDGNVLLRRTQYRAADSEEQSCRIAARMIFGKLYNSRWSIERTRRDHAVRVDVQALMEASANIRELLPQVLEAESLDLLRGLEGNSARCYFGVFDEMILSGKPAFAFKGRNRRPPLDPINALLSFTYSILAHDCASALEAAGLDPYVGFLHRDRPGRTSLALDLMEELRPCMADRFVLTLVNNRIIKEKDFIRQESGAVLLNDEGRRRFFASWQEKKREQLKHPYLEEKLQWGMVPYVQAQLLARLLRGDLDGYPPFLWK